MQTFEQYGFRLVPNETVSETIYAETKKGIEFVCRLVEDTAKKLSIEHGVFVYANTGNNACNPTVCIDNGQVYFGVYDITTQTTSSVCDIVNLLGFNFDAFDSFGERCYMMLHQMNRGREFNMGHVRDAWRGILAERQPFERK